MRPRSYLYKYGLPFSQDLADDINEQMDRIKHGKASMILIDGAIGLGKTTLAVHIADFAQGKEISFDDQLGLGGADFTLKLKVCYKKKLLVVIYDEAGDFSSRGALTKFNHMLNRVFETYRAYKILVILCLPLFSILDKSIFHKQIPRFLIHIDDRTDNQGDYRVYSLWHMWYLLHKMKKLIVPTDAYRFTEPCKFGHFLNLPPERAKKLDEISTKNKLNILGGNKEEQIDGLMNYKQLAEALGRSNNWTRKAVSELGIKAKKLYKAQKYFDENTLNKLCEFVNENNTIIGVSKIDKLQRNNEKSEA